MPTQDNEIEIVESLPSIDLTPMWTSILPVLVEILAHPPTPEAKEIALSEIRNMARVADLYVDSKQK